MDVNGLNTRLVRRIAFSKSLDFRALMEFLRQNHGYASRTKTGMAQSSHSIGGAVKLRESQDMQFLCISQKRC
jgi:hypothetical protein